MSPLSFEHQEIKTLSSNFYFPISRKVLGSVLLLHGSEGGGFGYHDFDAQILASHGFATLAFTWCGSPRAPVKGLPSVVIDIALERTIEAMRWLRKNPQLAATKQAICGVSRGAEQAIILAALSTQTDEIPKPDAVAVLAPSDVYVSGFSWNWQSVGGPEPDDPNAYAWKWQGRNCGEIGQAIPLESFNGPVLLCHGEDDEIWSIERSRNLEERLRSAQRKVQTHYMVGEKHALSSAGLHSYRSTLVDFLERTLDC